MAGDNDHLIIEPATFTRADPTRESRRLYLKPVPVAIASALAILIVAVGFMFSARAVRLETEPADASVTVTAGFFTYRLGERYMMLPGDYVVDAHRPGYESLSQQITVTGEADQEFSLSMQRLPGILTITTIPEVTATVLVDQQPVGRTPLVLDEIAPGLHDISIQPERYLPFDTEIDIEGMRVAQEIVAELAPAWAEVTLDSMPGGATILADDVEVGQTPATIELLRGTRMLQLRQPGFKTWQTSLEVTAGIDQALDTVQLIRADGTVLVATDPDSASVTINDRFEGQTPLEIKLRPGERYRIELSKAGFEKETRTVDVAADEDVALSVRLRPVMGVIRLMVEPAGAELFVDGVSRGEPGQQIELTASSHDIEIRKPGYATYRTEVTPKPGLTQQLMVQLQTEDEAALAAIPTAFASAGGPEFKLIIPDELSMGAGRREPGRRSNEIEKSVRLTRPYYLSVHEVSNEQFQQFAPNHDSGVLGRSLLNQGERPVVNVSWEDAARFCNWLSQKDGLPPAYVLKDGRFQAVVPMTIGYRLPTEAEWAWAARYASGTPTRFPWGEVMPPTEVHANYADESARNMVPYFIAGYDDTYRGPAPVGSFFANTLGIHDLAGNVSEWIHDFYSIELVREQLVDPTGPEQGEYHVVRGSNYTHGRFSELRWTFRDYGSAPKPDVGFRVARYVE